MGGAKTAKFAKGDEINLVVIDSKSLVLKRTCSFSTFTGFDPKQGISFFSLRDFHGRFYFGFRNERTHFTDFCRNQGASCF